MFQNIPKVKAGIVAVSRDCFPESLSVNRRKALVEAYRAKYDEADIYECPVCIVECEIHMQQALVLLDWEHSLLCLTEQQSICIKQKSWKKLLL